MSDEPVLTSSYCTNWAAYNTPRLWAMVADEDDPDSWRQVAAWGDVASAMKDHRARLEHARDQLAAAWPPGQNESAAAFVREFDTLLARMEQARSDADTTATGLANILEELRQAKNDIKPLYDEYKKKNNDIVPGWMDNAEDDLDEKARNRMIAAEGVVGMHVAQIKVPEPYRMDPNERSGYQPEGQKRTTGSGSTGGRSGGPGGGSGASGGPHTVAPVQVPHDPPPTLPGHDPIQPGDQLPGGGPGGGSGAGSGAGLAGVAPAPPAVLPPGNPGVPPVIGGPPPPPAPMPPVVPGLPGFPGGGGGGGALPTKNMPGGTPIAGRPAGVRSAMPSGAVIGETIGGGAGRGNVGGVAGRGGPGSVGGVAGRGGAGSVGGVAGRGAGAPGRGAAAGAGAGRTGKPIRPSWLPPDEPGAGGRGRSAAMAGAGRGHAEEESEAEGRQFDPDNPWEVEAGVAPVIRPRPQTGRHDPGPNVIGGYR